MEHVADCDLDKQGLQYSAFTKEMCEQNYIQLTSNYYLFYFYCYTSVYPLHKRERKKLLEGSTLIIISLPLLLTASYTMKLIALQ